MRFVDVVGRAYYRAGHRQRRFSFDFCRNCGFRARKHLTNYGQVGSFPIALISPLFRHGSVYYRRSGHGQRRPAQYSGVLRQTCPGRAHVRGSVHLPALKHQSDHLCPVYHAFSRHDREFPVGGRRCCGQYSPNRGRSFPESVDLWRFIFYLGLRFHLLLHSRYF